MKILFVLLSFVAMLFVAGCPADNNTSEGGGSTEVNVNDGGVANIVNNDVQVDGEGNSSIIDQLNPVTTAPEPEEECELSEETCAELEE